MADGEKVIRINIEEEMKSAYIDYSMSVIVSRALPDVRDGLKPVQRRVLFGMNELGMSAGRPYKKSARIVGEVLGKYHPHGDSSVYEAMVRMAQDWSLRYPLVDGQGNFGSIDGDSPAAMRYTEVRLKRIAEETLADLEKNTVDFRLNFDDSLEEPTVLPTRIPLLLVNGASGIAVGMATNMPPHNLGEVVDGTIAFIDNPEITAEGLAHFVKGPDFPTGGIIYGYDGVREAIETGRGRILVRGRSEIEVSQNREKIIITEIPFQVNKAELIKKIADLINEKKIEGISNINDESDRSGMRIVIDVKRDSQSNVVLNKLYKYTQLQSTFSVNNIALVDGRPRLLNLKDLISKFVDHRHDVVVRRTKFELEQAEKRAHILEGLLIALDHLDAVIALIRGSQTTDEAKDGLMTNFALTEIQAKAILDLRLQRLTGLERDKIKEEYSQLMELITYLRSVLDDRDLRMKIIKEELILIKEKYADARKTEIIYASEEMNPEDFYEDEEVVITISHMGYIKRTVLTEYKTQNRGGVGARGSAARDDDFLEHLLVASMHHTMLFFTEKGKVFWLRVWDIPEGSKISKGRAIQNILNLDPGDKVRAYIPVKSLNDTSYTRRNYITLCTKKGVIKKTNLEAYSRPRLTGIIALNIREGDQLIEAKLTNGNHEILMANRMGRAVHFPEKNVRASGRQAAGVRGMKLQDEFEDEIVGLVIADPGGSETILVVSENGYGKRSALPDYRIANRGGKGVSTLKITEKTGRLIAIKAVIDADDLMIITKSGLTIRLNVSDIRIQGRATQGVKLINLKENDSIAAVAAIEVNEVKEESEKGELELDAISSLLPDDIGNEMPESLENDPELDELDEEEEVLDDEVEEEEGDEEEGEIEEEDEKDR